MSNLAFAQLGLASKHTVCPLTHLEFYREGNTVQLGKSRGSFLGCTGNLLLPRSPLVRRLPAVLLSHSILGTLQKMASSFFNFYFLRHFILFIPSVPFSFSCFYSLPVMTNWQCFLAFLCSSCSGYKSY